MSGKDRDSGDKKPAAGAIIGDMVLSPQRPDSPLAGLVVDPELTAEGAGNRDQFSQEIQRSLKETEEQVLKSRQIASDPVQARSWIRAGEVVAQFQPVPWFIWRISNYVLGRPGHVNKVSESMVLGLRRLIFAAASDEILGTGEKVNNMRKALEIVPADVIAAVSVIHAMCRRLATRQFDRIWRPILDDALLRCTIACLVAKEGDDFGVGRAMLAGFSSRSGLAVLIATGELDQARRSLEMLAGGTSIADVGMAIYQCNPLQVSAMVLSAAGCGRDAAFGTVSYAHSSPMAMIENEQQLKWLAAFTIVDAVRTGTSSTVGDNLWNALGYEDQKERDQLVDVTKKLVRRGHNWHWLL